MKIIYIDKQLYRLFIEMWTRRYKDYPTDTNLKKEQIESGNGICEMHELFGWGENYHQRLPPKKVGFFRTLLRSLFGDR